MLIASECGVFGVVVGAVCGFMWRRFRPSVPVTFPKRACRDCLGRGVVAVVSNQRHQPQSLPLVC
jgi:hypothetical protein